MLTSVTFLFLLAVQAREVVAGGDADEVPPNALGKSSKSATATTEHDGHDGGPRSSLSCPSWPVVAVVFPLLNSPKLHVGACPERCRKTSPR